MRRRVRVPIGVDKETAVSTSALSSDSYEITPMDCSFSPMRVLGRNQSYLLLSFRCFSSRIRRCNETLLSEFKDHFASPSHLALTGNRYCTDNAAANATMLPDITSKRAASEHQSGSEMMERDYKSINDQQNNPSQYRGQAASPTDMLLALPRTRFWGITSTCPAALFLRISRCGNKRVLRARG